MSDLVFFGAGASKPFGIPTMHDMVVEVEQELDDKKLRDFYYEIKKKLIEVYGDSKTDIELILSIIDEIVKNKNSVYLGSFVFYYIQSPDQIELAKKIQKKIRNYIKKTCKISNDSEKNNDVYNQTYLPLFKHLSKVKTAYGKTALARIWKAYTTNYDRIFEGFWQAFELPEDHFIRLESSEYCVFTIKELQGKRTFCKMHGSLDWTNDVEQNRVIRKANSGFDRFKTEGDVMLFPIREKDLYLDPWFTLFRDLKSGLSIKDKLYAIGYAFNDEFIKNAFQEALAHDSNKKLIIINPYAKDIKKKFSESVKKQIEILPINFGGEFFELQFEDYIKEVKTIVIKFDIKKSEKQHIPLSIRSNHLIQSANFEKGVFERNGISSMAASATADGKYVHFEIPSLQNLEIKSDLEIEYVYGEEIELYISDDVKDLNFDIYYCSLMIASSDDIKHEYEKRNGKQYTIEPIKLDTTKLYRR